MYTLQRGAQHAVAHCLKGSAVPWKGDGCDNLHVAHTLRGEGFDASEDGTGRGTPLVPVAFTCKDHGADAGEVCPTLRAMPHDQSHANGGGQVAIAFSANQRGEIRERPVHGCLAGSKSGKQFDGIIQRTGVRRLTPRECERLQGFPDDYTATGKQSDSARYKQLGNAVNVAVSRWIGKRIAASLEALTSQPSV